MCKPPSHMRHEGGGQEGNPLSVRTHTVGPGLIQPVETIVQRETDCPKHTISADFNAAHRHAEETTKNVVK
jgi:hypothetical protein